MTGLQEEGGRESFSQAAAQAPGSGETASADSGAASQEPRRRAGAFQRYLLIWPLWRYGLPGVRISIAATFLVMAWGGGSPRWLSAAWLLASLYLLYVPATDGGPPEEARLGLGVVTLLGAVWWMDHRGFWILATLWSACLVAEAAFVHTWREVTAVTALCTGALWWHRFDAGNWTWTTTLVAGALGLACVWQRGQWELRSAYLGRQLVQARAESLRARLEERERFANDFHDGPLQQFVGLQMGLQVAQRKLELDPREGARELSQLARQMQNQVADLRDFVRSVRLEQHALAKLTQAVDSLVTAFSRDTGIEAELTGSADLNEEKQEEAIQVLQIVREALNNARRHSGATHVHVTLEEKDGWLGITLEDNGQGFWFEGTRTMEELEKAGRGPSSILRRVRLLAGRLEISSKPGEGACLRVQIPQ